MLPAEPEVLLCRQGFADAQAGMASAVIALGFYSVGWYGTSVSDERGSFCIVNGSGPLLTFVGDFLNVQINQRSVSVYCIGSQATLTTDLALTRRAYAAISLLANEPIRAKVSQVSL